MPSVVIKSDMTITIPLEEVKEMVRDFLAKKRIVVDNYEEFKVNHVLRTEEIHIGVYDCDYVKHFDGLTVKLSNKSEPKPVTRND